MLPTAVARQAKTHLEYHPSAHVPLEAREGFLEAFAFQALAFQLAGAANGFGLFTGFAFGGLLERAAKFHFTKDTFTLQFLFQRLQGLVDIVVANSD